MTGFDFLFKDKRPDTEKLQAFGFRKIKDSLTYSAPLLNGQFEARISVLKTGEITADVFDMATDEIYAPVKVFGAKGAFVGKVRSEYEKLLAEISTRCFSLGEFKSDFAIKAASYAKKKYKDELEFLWPKTPQNAIIRRKDNRKWYVVLMTVSKSKFALDGDDPIEVIALRNDTETIEKMVDGVKYFPGYHMNKKHWYAMLLDGSVPIEEICDWIDLSYKLAKK